MGIWVPMVLRVYLCPCSMCGSVGPRTLRADQWDPCVPHRDPTEAVWAAYKTCRPTGVWELCGRPAGFHNPMFFVGICGKYMPGTIFCSIIAENPPVLFFIYPFCCCPTRHLVSSFFFQDPAYYGCGGLRCNHLSVHPVALFHEAIR